MKLTRPHFMIGTSIAAILISYSGAKAAGIWDGGGEVTPTTPGNYDTANNWDNNAVPAAINVDVSNGGTILVTTNHTTGDILAGTGAGTSGTWSQSAGNQTMGGGWFRLGLATGSTGNYNLSGGTLTTVGRQNIGEATGGTGTVSVSGTGTWINNGNQMAVGGNSAATAGGTGTLNLSGSGLITCNNELWVGVGTGSVGITNISGGTINVANWLAVGRTGGSGTINMSGGTYNKTVNPTNATIIGASGSGTINQNAGTFNVSSGDTWLGETNTGVWRMSGGATNLLVLNVGQGGGSNGTLTLQNSASGATGPLANGGGTEVLTAGAMLIGNNATATGTVNLDGGTLAINSIGRSAGTGTLNLNGGKLQARAATVTFVNNLTRANVRNSGALIDTQAFDVTIPQALVHSNVGGDAATDGGLTKQGAANLTLSGANTFTGDTVVSLGTLTTANATALGGSALNYNNQGGTVSFGTLTATTFGGLKGSQALALTNTTAAAVALSVGNNNSSNTYTGILSGSGSLIKLGTGSFTLTNPANNFTGNVTINTGSLIVPNSNALGTTAKTIDIAVNGTTGNPSLHLDGSGGSVNLPAVFTYASSNTAGGFINDAGVNSIAGQINLTNGGGNTTFISNAGTLNVTANLTPIQTARALAVQGAGNGSISGLIVDGTTVGLPVSKNGAGTWVLSGLNTYTGATTVNAGILQAGVSQSGAAGALGTNSPLVMTNAAGAVLDLNGFNATVGSLNGGGTLGGNITLGAGTLTTGGLNAASSYGGVISGGGGFTKTGTQTLTLTNASTYGGATTISTGTLSLDHSGANLGVLGNTAVGVDVSGTLLVKGNAAIGTTTAGTLTSIGTVSLQEATINTLTVAGGASLTDSSLKFDLSGNGVPGGGTADQIVTGAAGSISGNNTVNLNLLLGQTLSTGDYTLITAPGGLGSGGAGLAVGSKPAGFYSYTFGSSTPTAVVLTISGVASPSIAYWTGLGSDGEGDALNKWASGSSIPKSNWSTTVAGTSDPLQVPGAATDVIFTASNAISSGVLVTQLDANYSIKSLTFDTSPMAGSTTDLHLDSNGNTLTLGTGGLTVASTNDSTTTIDGIGAIVLNGSQSWANNSNTQPLSVNPAISGFTGATTFTLNGTGSGGITLQGVIGTGTATSVGLLLNQAGVTTLSGNNTFTGGVVIAGGTLRMGSAGALNSTTPNTLTFGAGSTGGLQINGNNVTVASLGTNATPGTPFIENASASAATLTDNIAAGNSTYAGLLQNGSGGGALSFTKAGAGALALTNQNTYTGTTLIGAGTLTLGSAENAGTSGPLGNGGPISFVGGGTFQYGGSNQFDYSSRFSATGAQQFKIDTNGQNVTYVTSLTGTGGNIQKYGAGTLTLTGTTSAVGNVFGHGGTLLLDLGGKITTTGFSSVGAGTGDNSTVTVQSTSQLLVTGDFNISDVTGSNGVLNIADTAAVKGTTFYIGKSGTATGTVNQTGGSLAVTAGASEWRIGGSLAADAAAVGIYNISGGNFTAPGNFQIGAWGSGAINISGTGIVTNSGGFGSVGRNLTGFGVVDVNGGQFNFTVAANRLIIGEEGTGTLNVRAGLVTNSSTSATAALTLGNNATGSGTLNLLGGTLTTASVGTVNATATSRVNFNGGTLKASAASATYLGGLTSAFVYQGGANIDADGKAITIGQALLTPATSNGLQSVAVTNGGSGYNTAPIVKIANGGGTGATAVATVSGGAVTGIVVTNPGVGYTGTPDVVLVNGLSGGSGATFSPAMAANSSGGLAVSSTTAGGVVTLTGASTFTGNTTISTGATLQLGNGTTGNDGSIAGSTTITNNGTLVYNRFGAASYSGTIVGTGAVSKLGAGTQILAGTNTYTGVTTVGGGVLSVADLGNGLANSNIGASSAASANLVFSGNGTLLYTGGSALVTDRGYTVGTGGGGIDHASNVTIGGQILSSATGSFTKNGAGILNYTNITGTNNLTGGNVGNGLGYIVSAGLVNLGGTTGSPLAQTNIVTGELIIGNINSGASPAAEMDINGGNTTITSYIGVGRGNGTNNAATALVVNTATVTSGNFAIGYDNGVANYKSSPTVTFNGASSYTDSGVFTVGESGNAAGGVSTVNVNGTSSVTLTSTAANAFSIGLNGAAVFNQNGGSVTTTSSTNGIITIARNAASTSTYHLNGGTLTALGVVGAAGNSTLNLNGGTLTPTAASATFLQGLTRANVRNNGALVNTATLNVTVAQSLVHSDVGGDAAIDGGLTKQGAGTLTLTGLNTYTGTTTVVAGTLAVNGSALPDTGKLVIDGGKVEPTGTEVVDALYFGATLQASGTWGSTLSTAIHQDDTRFSGTGVVSVTTGAAGGYASYASSHGLSLVPNEDTDADGMSNGVEYFMNAATGYTSNPGIVNGKVTWPKDPAFSGTYTVQISPDLVNWADVSSTVVGNTVEYTVPTGQAKEFVRLNVKPN